MRHLLRMLILLIKSGNVVTGNRTEWSYGRFGRFQGYGSSFNYTFNNDTWKKWFGPKEDEDKDKKKPEGDDEDSEGSEEDGTVTKKVENGASGLGRLSGIQNALVFEF